MIVFTRDLLQRLELSGLQLLAHYYNVEYNDLTKDELVPILEKLFLELHRREEAQQSGITDEDYEAHRLGVSVQILRIRKSQEKQNV